MDTRIILSACAIFVGILGIILLFLPNEIALYLGAGTSNLTLILLQLLGGLYFGFAMLNWMAKGALIGGIYSRPLVVGNLAHFFTGGLALGKVMFNQTELPGLLWILVLCYAVFAILFGLLLNRHPVQE
jgi:hypothetical protein